MLKGVDTMKYFSAFTGAAGFDLGVPESWKCVGFSEIDRHANEILRYRFKDVKNYGDIEKIKYEEIPDFEVLVGGSPCQDISVAGKREGLAGLRSRLFYSFIEILKRKKPEYFLFENVKGLLSSNGGRDFATVIDKFSEAGYSNLWWQVLDAKNFGVPQHRERVFIFGTSGAERIREVLFKARDSKTDNVLQGQSVNTIRSQYRRNESNGSYVVESQRIPQIVASRGRMKNGKWTQQLESRSDGTNTITSVGKDNMLDIDGRIRYLTPLECERLMGWPDNWTKYGIDEKGNAIELSDNMRYNIIGNGVVPIVVRNVIEVLMDGLQ